MPVLVGAGPVQTVSGAHICVWVEVKPALSRGVPSQIERLEAATVDLYEVLLQRKDARTSHS
ncbi:hypothetical protein A4U53_039795 (plasmid) [Rhizobium ruizarguesonis]|uniref:Uncharacterized protein n=1 Tax=Rhizobium ruizarguesonis TaxID=2081791 RepID=A0ACD5EX62_9HYPH